MEVAPNQARKTHRDERKVRWNRRRDERQKKPEKEMKNQPIRAEEEEEEEDREIVDEEEIDQGAMRMFRCGWELCFGRSHGSFQDNTSLGPMRSTEGSIPDYAECESVLQVFSVQVTELKDGLKWPLHVYGHVAIRDFLDYNRNLLFERKRDNCQILTEQDSSLVLTGPSRAVVINDPVTFEVDLSVKGETESEDKVLSLKSFHHDRVISYKNNAFTIHRYCSSKRGMVELKFTALHSAVEATVVSAKVVSGSWLDHYRGRIVCHTATSNEDIVLLDSRDGRMHVTYDGETEISRSVVSVELSGQLIFRVVASQVGDKTDVVLEGAAIFPPKMNGKSRGTCDLSFCKVEITVAWSLFSTMEDLRLQGRL
ncbi:hypothetical protein BS78_02G234300 [Paspalum vaginatum]|nr:hypothetical protein BS78_02G234300 [Paspalum vaginatum]